jgi:hypothetical protein
MTKSHNDAGERIDRAGEAFELLTWGGRRRAAEASDDEIKATIRAAVDMALEDRAAASSDMAMSADASRLVRINRDSHYDEYRVPAPDGREAGAYYTNDKGDAEDTARAMYAGESITIKHTHGRHPKGRE